MCVSACSPKRPELRRPVALAFAAALFISGCAAPRSAPLPEIDSWNARTAVLGGLDEWEFSGRIAVKTDTDGFNGKLRWTQDADAFSATVSGPLSIGKVRIEGDGRAVIMTDKDGKRTALDDVELELRYRYGWTIPVESLRYWALGIPDPSTPAQTRLNAAGQLESLAQRGWAVSISRYAAGGGQPMPKLLTAENADTRVRLVIDHWIFFE